MRFFGEPVNVFVVGDFVFAQVFFEPEKEMVSQLLGSVAKSR
jgi:hypothetical protein